jgi:hypothetical protein
MSNEEILTVVEAKLREVPPHGSWCRRCGGLVVSPVLQTCRTCGGDLEPLYSMREIREALRPVPLARAIALLQAAQATAK